MEPTLTGLETTETRPTKGKTTRSATNTITSDLCRRRQGGRRRLKPTGEMDLSEVKQTDTDHCGHRVRTHKLTGAGLVNGGADGRAAHRTTPIIIYITLMRFGLRREWICRKC
ncbi:hypothetical protein QL285_085833 [Trifolium repens]|nr:hypothetical protein QL285_085833 [Trifolium repens]